MDILGGTFYYCGDTVKSVNRFNMIPDRALQLLDKEGFIAAYYEGVSGGAVL
jgi:hypothetical protein